MVAAAMRIGRVVDCDPRRHLRWQVRVQQMSNTNNNQKLNIKVGEYYHVLRDLGVKGLSNGPQISERFDAMVEGHDTITPDESLLCLEKSGSGYWLFERENGLKVRGHINHFDPNSSYNKAKSRTGSTSRAAPPMSIDQQIEVQRGRVKVAEERLLSQMKKLKQLQDQLPTSSEEYEAEKTKIRQQAAELMNTGPVNTDEVKERVEAEKDIEEMSEEELEAATAASA